MTKVIIAGTGNAALCAALAALENGADVLMLEKADEALAAHRVWIDRMASLPGKVEPLIRDPASMADLLSHQLIGGVISARET